MKFHDEVKMSLSRFINRMNQERDVTELKNYISSLKAYENFGTYFDQVVKSLNSESNDWNTQMKYSRIRTDLSIVAGLYYGDDLSLRHLERDYKPDLSREQLRQEVMTFTSHILFGRDVSGVEQVGDLRIEKEGLIPIMDGIMVSGKTRQEQKSELMNCLRVYGILSEKSMQEAREAADRDPDVILARNTSQNRGGAIKTSFAAMVDGKKVDGGKRVTFVNGGPR